MALSCAWARGCRYITVPETFSPLESFDESPPEALAWPRFAIGHGMRPLPFGQRETSFRLASSVQRKPSNYLQYAYARKRECHDTLSGLWCCLYVTRSDPVAGEGEEAPRCAKTTSTRLADTCTPPRIKT